MSKRLNILISILFIGLTQTICIAQEPEPILLNTLEDWRYEKIDFPLDFAPTLVYDGFEELRFSPGMFDTTSKTYFTYLFAISFNNISKISKSELKSFLSAYYKGLCNEVAKGKKMEVDTSQIEINLYKHKNIKSKGKNYTAELLFFDTFTDGRKVVLHMEIDLLKDKAKKQLYLFAKVSPQPKQSIIWKEMHQAIEKTKTQKLSHIK